jgi:Uma2 family endonuclease
MPEPDISVVRGVADDYQDLDPVPPDVALIVEVSDSSLEDDRAMAQTYGGGGIPVYWLVDLVNRRLEVYAHPVEGVYPAPTVLGEAQSVELILDGRPAGPIAVADLLPRP